MTQEPAIRVGLTRDGLERIEIFADTRQDRDRAIRAVLSVSEELEELESGIRKVLADRTVISVHR
jgi:hypothetical protein